MRLTATCPTGIEPALVREWNALGAQETDCAPGSVSVPFDAALLYHAHERLRSASRLLVEIAQGTVTDADSLYAFVRDLRWEEHFRKGRTIAVRATGANRELRHTRFIAQRTKDAIVDRLRDQRGTRPDVDLDNPDLIAFVHVHADRAWAGVDISGRGLHRRGYRQGAAAPIRENLAAGLLELAGWSTDGTEEARTFLDPMCGSGTLVIEAALMTANIAPGALRRVSGQPSGFEAWQQYDADLHRAAMTNARADLDAPLRFVAQDISPDNIENLNAALRALSSSCGFPKSWVETSAVDFFAAKAPAANGFLITNPPYGERLGGHIDEAKPLFRRLGDTLKQQYAGWDAWILCGDKRLAKAVGLRAEQSTPVMHGGMDARLCHFPIHAGSKAVTTNEHSSSERSPNQHNSSERNPKQRSRNAEAQMFFNRLRKNWKKLRKEAALQETTAFRVYDRDIPEFNFSVDWYDGHVRVEERERPRHVEEHQADRRRQDALDVVQELFSLGPDDVTFRVRSKSQQQQDTRIDADDVRNIQERGHTFEVNLKRYLDTGLFLDGGAVRQWISDHAQGCAFLNLFSYTCAASVFAAAGGARSCTNVDLSKTALAWGRRNAKLNGVAHDMQFEAADVVPWLEKDGRQFDLIYAGIPSYSASNRAQEPFDAVRGQARWLHAMMRRLARDGTLLLSTHAREFRPAPELARKYHWQDQSAPLRALGFRKSPLSQKVFLVRHTQS